MKSYLKKRQEERRETATFRDIVRKRALQARRQAYAREAVKQAKVQGKRIAIQRAKPKPSLGKRMIKYTQQTQTGKRKRKATGQSAKDLIEKWI